MKKGAETKMTALQLSFKFQSKQNKESKLDTNLLQTTREISNKNHQNKTNSDKSTSLEKIKNLNNKKSKLYFSSQETHRTFQLYERIQ
jgi:hypothetical protein